MSKNLLDDFEFLMRRQQFCMTFCGYVKFTHYVMFGSKYSLGENDERAFLSTKSR